MAKRAAGDRPVGTARDPARRVRVLAAAKRHFTLYGLKGTRLEAVAAEAGCAKGALYLEFADKEALLRAVVGEVFDEVRRRYAAEVLAVESPRARLAATLAFAYRQYAAEPLFARLMGEDPDFTALQPRAAAEVEQARAQVDMLRGWVDEGIAGGEIRGDVDREAVPYVLGVLRALPMHLAPMAGYMAGERILAAVVDIFAAGLAARASGAASGRAGAVRRSKARRRG